MPGPARVYVSKIDCSDCGCPFYQLHGVNHDRFLFCVL